MNVYIYIYKAISLRLVTSETKIKKYSKQHLHFVLTYKKNANVINVFFYLKINF